LVDDFQYWVKFWEEIWWIAMAFVKSESRVLFVNFGAFVMMFGLVGFLSVGDFWEMMG
jgi:hypothetical protein